MKIVTLLSFYDESASWLAAVVAGCGRFSDAVVAVDGGYMLYPGARPRSMPEQTEAILWAAEASGLECIIHRPSDVWRGNEVQKRNQTVALAGTLCVPDEDWLVVMDADMHLVRANREAVRADLEATDCDVATMTILEGADFLADPEMSGLVQNELMGIDYEWTQKHRLVYRYHPSLSYGPRHWWVTRDDRDGEREWLWGPTETQTLAPEIDLLAGMVCYHRSGARAAHRREAAKVYYDTRDMFGAENPPPDEVVTSHKPKSVRPA